MKWSALVLGVALMFGAACFEELDSFLYLNWTEVPDDTVSTPEVTIAGQVVRTTPRQGLVTVVTARGGASIVADTASDFGLFNLVVPLTLNAENRIVVSARDNTGVTTPDPRTFVVVHRDAAPTAEGHPTAKR